MLRKPLVAGNWKMNGRREMASRLATEIAAAVPAGVDVLLCPPAPYLERVGAQLASSGVLLGGQNLGGSEDGAFTGEVSSGMLADVGCSHVLVGHSERRQLFSESDAVVAGKFYSALEAGLTPILCVGETLQEREAGDTETVIARQMDAVLTLGAEKAEHFIVAYEPVWAIGTGMTATPEQAQAVHRFIRERLVGAIGEVRAQATRLLYGGSVKADNAASLFAGTDIDGGLIGGASLDAETFLAICQAATA